MRTLVVVTAGLSTPSTTRRLADEIQSTCRAKITARGEAAEVEVIEVRELAAELAAAMTDWDSQTPKLDAAKQQLVDADGLIVVTPVFQGSYSGLFKMFFDVIDPVALNGKPTLIAATAGSARHGAVLDYALRPLFTFLHAPVVPTGIFQATEDFGTKEGDKLLQRIQRAAGELADLVVRAKDHVGGLADERTGQGSEAPSVHNASGAAEGEDFTPLGVFLRRG